MTTFTDHARPIVRRSAMALRGPSGSRGLWGGSAA